MWISQPMSKTLSPHENDQAALADLINLLGGDSHVEIERDLEEEYVAETINRARGLLARALAEEKMSPAALARKMNVDRSLVTRFFKSQGDMKMSTLALFARALNRKWIIDLEVSQQKKFGNYFPPVCTSGPVSGQLHYSDASQGLPENLSPDELYVYFYGISSNTPEMVEA